MDISSRGIRCRSMSWNDEAYRCAEEEAQSRALFFESIGELDPSFWIEFRGDSWQAWTRSKNALARETQISEQEQNPSLDLGLLAKEQEQEAEQQRDDPSSDDPTCGICRYDARDGQKELLLADPVSVIDVLETPAKKPRSAISS